MRIGFFLFCLFFIGLFIFLGCWQLHRYHEKQHLLLTYQNHVTEAAKPFAKLKASKEEIQFQHVAVSGSYDNKLIILIQNRIYHDQVGFEVITPLKMRGNKKLLLIDRGWIPQSSAKALPKIDEVNGKQRITGYIKLLNERQFILGKNILDSEAKPIIMQKMDVNELTLITHQDYYPYIVRLDATQKNGFVRDWTITTMIPQRHLGYAVQWFAMALVLLIAYFCFERVKK